VNNMNNPVTQNPDQLALGNDVAPTSEIVSRIDGKFRPVWEALPPDQRTAMASYFLPHKSSKDSLAPTRPRLIKWYCPFAGQSTFPSGHRYCINTYTGCAHRCRYCYAAGYEPDEPSAKRDFASNLAKDLADLERFDVPSAPVHLSNSTDPFQQELEVRFGHTKFALEGLLAHRRRFSTVTVLTKNPGLAARQDYARILAALGDPSASHPAAGKWKTVGAPAVQVEVSLAFWREEARAFWDPGAPPVAERIAGIQALREAGIPVVLRIDPLFPRSPLPSSPSRNLSDFGLVEAQTVEDLENLVGFAKTSGLRHVVYSPVKIVQPRRSKMGPEMRRLLDVYRALAWPERAVWRGGSWRLPSLVAERNVTGPFLDICRRNGMTAKFCMRNLVETF
jgi:DNA repair photolyase